jgi:hypothetical protein
MWQPNKFHRLTLDAEVAGAKLDVREVFHGANFKPSYEAKVASFSA